MTSTVRVLACRDVHGSARPHAPAICARTSRSLRANGAAALYILAIAIVLASLFVVPRPVSLDVASAVAHVVFELTVDGVEGVADRALDISVALVARGGDFGPR